MNNAPAPERVRLAVLPTPLVEAPRLRAALGIQGRLLVKRDDLTGFAVAGNKARPLEYLAAEALACGADTLVTGGTPGSNFCQAAAATAARIGMKCELTYAGHHDGRDREHPNLLASRRWGANIRWTENSDRSSVDDALQLRADNLRADGDRPYVIPRGGATPLGSVGYYFAAQELADQLDGPALIVIAVGSGGSLAGLLAGAVAAEAPWKVAGVSVSRPPEPVTARVLELAAGCATRMGTPAPTESDLWIHDARGPGHGLPSAEGTRAADIALRTEGIVLDPVYTAKALGALPEMCRSHAARDLTTIFWHTGGLLDAVNEWGTS
jgi:D-cysteine desulfhydrase